MNGEKRTTSLTPENETYLRRMRLPLRLGRVAAVALSILATLMLLTGVVTGVVDAETAATSLLPILTALANVKVGNGSAVNATGV